MCRVRVAHATDSSISRALLLLLFADSSSIPRRCSGRSLRTRSLGGLALPAPLFPSQGLPCSLWQCFLCRAPADTIAPPLLVEAVCVNRTSERGNRPTAVADASSQANGVPACNAASVVRATEDPPGRAQRLALAGDVPIVPRHGEIQRPLDWYCADLTAGACSGCPTEPRCVGARKQAQREMRLCAPNKRSEAPQHRVLCGE